MTSDTTPGADPAVEPQVIDLDAVEVMADEPPRDTAAEPPRPETPPTPQRRRRSRTWAWIALALVIGGFAGGWLYRDLLSSYLPSSAMTEMAARIGAVEVTNQTLAGQVQTAITTAGNASQKISAIDAAIKDASTAAANATAAASALGNRIATLEHALQASKADLDKLRASLSSAPATGGGTADPAALTAIAQRLDALEKDVAALKAGSGSAGNAAMISALRQALADVQAKIAAGAPYRSDLDTVLRIVPAAGSDVLMSFAGNGLPNAAGLAAELRNAIASLPKPAAPAPAGGYVSSLWTAVTSVVSIRDAGDSDWPLVAERAAKLAEAQQLPQAIAAIDAAQGAPPEAVVHWREHAVQRVKLEAAADDLARAVALTLAAKGGGQ